MLLPVYSVDEREKGVAKVRQAMMLRCGGVCFMGRSLTKRTTWPMKLSAKVFADIVAASEAIVAGAGVVIQK